MQVLILGSGQLARMMALASAPLNIDVYSYDVYSDCVVHPLTQQPYPLSLSQAIEDADVITAEFEHIPHAILNQCAASQKLFPSAAAIATGGDRCLEKQLLTECDVPNAHYSMLTCSSDLTKTIETLGLPLILKTALGGYDGKGQWRIKSASDLPIIKKELATFFTQHPEQTIVAEQWIPFEQEVSLIGVRDHDGRYQFYPLTTNHHQDGILALSIADGQHHPLQTQANSIFKAIANHLNYVGVLAIEFFEVNGKLVVNEIAPRVHNSGHWTQQGAQICQFENHIRAVCGLPLGSTTQRHPTAMVNILGEDSIPLALLENSQCHAHWYGKEKREGRKMGHINVEAKSAEHLVQQLQNLSLLLSQAAFPILHN